MRAGEIVAGRYRIERLAGSGGMGEVYRAEDMVTHRPIALKILHADATDAGRFAREANLLAALSHPGIVAYSSHGVAASGNGFLAMEWLEGKDLAAALAAGPLPVRESLMVIQQVADALAVAHARGVVHRDIKPGNIFLVNGRIDQVKLLDFGVARAARADGARTRTGALLGTPAYMAPEQARGAKNVDARADVFSLGCVLYDCLTGASPFTGEHLMAVLAKVILEIPPAPSTLVPGIPAHVDDLLASMLAKDPLERPADGEDVAKRIRAFATGSPAPARHRPFPTALTGDEERLFSVVAVRPDEEETAAISGTADTVLQPHRPSMSEVARAHQGIVLPLSDGSLLVKVAADGSPTDQAAQAARCAFALRVAMPNARVAVATGRGLATGSVPIGKVIDRAIALLAEASVGIPVDQATSALLDMRFEVVGGALGLELVRERPPSEEGRRTLLGRPTPFVGREREIAMIGAVLAACASEHLASIVLVTAPAGVGKSRLLREALPPFTGSEHAPQVWIGRGDPMHSGAPLGLLRAAIRATANIQEGEPATVAREKLAARLSRSLSASLVDRIAEFVGEMIGVHVSDEMASVPLRTARLNPTVMQDNKLRAFEEWLAAETVARPLLIVLEDLHWADPATVDFVDSAVRTLHDRPLAVLALARPDVHDVFPRLWAERGVQEIRMGELPRRAAEKLVRHVLGADVAPAMVSTIVERAAGNAFFLEELIRAVAAGDGNFPDTVLAMVEARLHRLDADTRRAIRAASVFGEVFWTGGLESLTGRRGSDALAELVDRELVEVRDTARFGGETEYVFRHALVREAAYAGLTNEDRTLGHMLAGDWLEGVGERDAFVLAQHFERGGARDRSARAYATAAEHALASNDLSGALARGEKAAAQGAAADVLGRVRVVELIAHRERGELEMAGACGREALDLLAAGTPEWLSAAEELIRPLELVDVLSLVEAAPRYPDASGPRVACLLAIAAVRVVAGRFDDADRILTAHYVEAEELSTTHPAVAARLAQVRAFRAGFAGDRELDLALLLAAAKSFDAAGEIRSALRTTLNTACVYLQIGAYDQAESVVAPVVASCRKLGHWTAACYGTILLAQATCRLGRVGEASVLAEDAVRQAQAAENVGTRRYRYYAQRVRAEVRWRRGDLVGAEEDVHEATLEDGPERTIALGLLARVLIEQGRVVAALDAGTRAMELWDGGLTADEDEYMIRLAYVEALTAAGAHDRARGALEKALGRLSSEADRLKDPRNRERFLAIPWHARLVELADRARPTASRAAT